MRISSAPTAIVLPISPPSASTLSVHRRRDLDGRLVGHHVGEGLVARDRVARLHVPGDELDLGDAFAEVGNLDDVDAHRASIVRLNAAATRAGPGK